MRVCGRKSRATLAALCLFGAACGSGDDDGATSGTIDAGVKGKVQQAVTGSTAAPAASEPTSMEEWEALWERERAAVVEKIEANGWGRSADGRTLTGPDGLTVDLGACSAWDDTEGISDTEVKVGHIAAMSGTLADAAGQVRAYEALFKAMNDAGGFPDSTGKVRKVTVVSRDDAYDPARAIPLVDELIDSEKVFTIGVVGSPTVLRTYDKLHQRCIPLIPSSGHPALADPVHHPWAIATSISYVTEAILWGTLIEQRIDEFGGKVKVAALALNNDFGTAYDEGFKAFLEQSPHRDSIEYVIERVEPTASTVKDQMTTLAATDPDVFIAMLAGTACLQTVNEAAENGMKESTKYKFYSSACKAGTKLTRDVAGEASEGWWTVGGGVKELNSAAFDEDPWVRYARDAFTAAGYDHKAWTSVNLGLVYSWGLAQSMLIAGQLDGGLTRSNLLLALRSIDMTHPHLLYGIGYNMSGGRDAFLIEGSDVSVWDVDAQAWVQEGPVIDISGTTKPCAWDAAAARCAPD